MTLDSNLENKILYFYKGLDVATLRDCNEEEVKEINERGYDVFWCLQQFSGTRRVKDDLQSVRYVTCDFDNISREEFSKRFQNYPKPTLLVKTRSGVHAYWKIRANSDNPNADQYREFVGERIVPLGADGNAKDACRILRVPGSRYWQDSKGNRYEDQEIRCEVIYDNGPEWKWEQLKRLFKVERSTTFGRDSNHVRGNVQDRSYEESKPNTNSFWSKCNSIPVEQGIEALSGHQCVKGQTFTFKQDSKIKRLYVNGVASNAWIDVRGRFGSTYDNTAGTLVNFLKFPEYGLDNAAIARVFKEVFNVE